MTREKLIVVTSGVIISTALLFVLAASVLKLLWAWVIPELFPGAVAQGLLVAALSWPAAFKLTVFIMVLAILVNRRCVCVSPENDNA